MMHRVGTSLVFLIDNTGRYLLSKHLDSTYYSCLKMPAHSILPTPQGGYYDYHHPYSNMRQLGHHGF